MKKKPKLWLILGYALGIGATILILYLFSLRKEPGLGELLGLIVVAMMYSAGSLCIWRGFRTGFQ